MIAQELVNNLIPPLKRHENAEKAIIWMEELKTNELPVVDDDLFQGLITEEDVFENGNLDTPLSEFILLGQDCFVRESQHVYDVIRMAYNHDVSLVAVINDKGQYVGIIDTNDIISSLAQTEFIQAPGAVLELAVNNMDYTLSEIARLVETENAKILSSYVTRELDQPDQLRITLKVNKEEVSHIVATLERFGYKVRNKYKETRDKNNDQERLDHLFRYLDL